MRSSILGSSLVHLAILAVLLVVRAASPIIVPGPDVVQVALVDAPPTPTMTAPLPPPPKPELDPAQIAPTEEEGVKLDKKKKKKEPEKREEREPEPPPTTARAALPYAKVGNAGLSGQISLDAADFEFTYYLMLVRNRIAQNWSPPAGLASASGTVRAVVYFKISRGGELSAVAVENSSGTEYFDRSATRAVTISNPLPPLPLGYSGSQLGVHFGFEYSAP